MSTRDTYIRASIAAHKNLEKKNLEEKIAAARELLACIHGDGGQYTEKVGFVQACKDAETKVLLLRFVHEWMDAYHPRELATALEAAKAANL